VELLSIDVPEEFSGKVIELVSQRKGEMTLMEQKGDLTHIEFNIPSRGLIGLRNLLLTASAGEAIIAHRFKDFEPWKGNIPSRTMGVFVSKEQGPATAYSIGYLQDRGSFFIDPGDQIYIGQVIGEHIRPGDLVVNVITGKKLTNMRASGSDGTTHITPKRNFSLEEALEYIQEDEYVELTPKSIRLRKVLLDENDRKKAAKQMEMAE
jgi:GTP-binding protein